MPLSAFESEKPGLPAKICQPSDNALQERHPQFQIRISHLQYISRVSVGLS